MRIARQELIAEAERIASRLLRTAVREDGLLSWWTPGAQQPVRTPTLYDGAAGTALFLLRLAETTGKAEYLDAATAALRWTDVSLRNGMPLGQGFYTGRLGIAWCWLQWSRITGERCDATLEWLTCDARDARRSHTADLLGGVAGTALGLLHVHAATGETAPLEAAADLAVELIARARPARVGLYWDRSSQQIRGLCGLSHGAAGIGWVLAELGRYVANDAFAELARDAFAYERSHFDPAAGNWADFRLNYQRASDYAELEAAYLRGDRARFFEHGDMNAWCHGAAGIGLSRLRAWEILGDGELLDEVRLAVRRVIADFEDGPEMPSATLCHGALGNAALLLAAAPHIDVADCDSIVHRAAAAAIATARANGFHASGDPSHRAEHASLLMGASGVGSFLLQLASGERRDPLLLPAVTADAPGAVPAVTLDETRASIAARHFPRTYALGGWSADRAEMFSRARSEHPEAREEVALEEARWSLAENTSLALVGVRGIVHEESADRLLGLGTLRLSEDAAIVTRSDGSETLLRAGIEEVAEVSLQPLASMILSRFEQPCRVEDAVRTILEAVDADADSLREAAMAQIRTALVQSILVPA